MPHEKLKPHRAKPLKATNELIDDIKYYAEQNESVNSTAYILGVHPRALHRIVRENSLKTFFGDPMKSNARKNALLGKRPDAAIAARKKTTKLHTYKGVTATLTQHATAANKSVWTVREHLRKGKSLAHALTTSRSSANLARVKSHAPISQGCGVGLT